ncbi:hypothetical protein [Parvularcula maris]|uniref:Uncharacterized protein n=1 Tax=Parvularcula maris TaxID=2965077 RepID=A0A9X2L934_9PROT|nr:hypothetical protein [Parvularcula maris]MCQ8184507.1 hypothetical protein [Parvularcula maris]
MGSFSQRRYIFRRRPVRARLAFAAAAVCVGLLAMNFSIAKTKPGGYMRQHLIEQPAQPST